MRKFLFGILLFASSLGWAQTSVEYLKWGKYSWPVKIVYNDLSTAEGSSRPPDFLFANSAENKYILEKPFYDSVSAVCVYTLEEVWEITLYDSLPYSIYEVAKRKDFARLLNITPKFTDTALVVTGLKLVSVNGTKGNRWSWSFGYSKRKTVKQRINLVDDVIIEFVVVHKVEEYKKTLKALLFILK